MSRPELTIGRDFCRGCNGASVQRFSGYATSGGENGVRPRAFYRQCDRCGLQRMVLGNVDDAEGLCRDVLRKWGRRAGTGTAVRPLVTFGNGALDMDDALSFLQGQIWDLYTKWQPTLIDSFLSYASGLLPKRLAVWSRESSGEAQERTGGRKVPKAHAASVSVSLDGFFTGEHDEGHDTVLDVGDAGDASRDGFGALVAGDAEAGADAVLRVLAGRGGKRARDQRRPGGAADGTAQARDRR